MFERSGHADGATAQRMEMRALIEAFRMLPADAETEIFCDCKVAVQTLTELAPQWRKKGWKRKNGPVANLDLVRKALELFEARPNCLLEWTKGHSGNQWNERADKLARTAAQEPRGTNRHGAISE